MRQHSTQQLSSTYLSACTKYLRALWQNLHRKGIEDRPHERKIVYDTHSILRDEISVVEYRPLLLTLH